ncbi:hypothetical protein HJC23_002823 [Cyclotella cryptica]|uniref:Uncharacterized protein n=1 Tax=Cyclotella cryptica TaxID=29204 RepID=A0ABD3PMI3_9STRA|eukprot:CCRYP_013102-RA/>CCRYP_013102-RA protein AED:0.19 eAED:0.19 QI:0/-1/0/1/-1/1/1/0/275
MTIELSNGAAHRSVSSQKDAANCSYLKLQRFDQIAREREEYAQQVKLLQRELDQCKKEIAELKSLSNVACEGRTEVNDSITAKNDADSMNITLSADTVDARITRAKMLAEEELTKHNGEGNCEKNDSVAESNKENRPVALNGAEIPDLDNEGGDIEKICNDSAAIITSLAHQLSETIHERDGLKRLVNELRCQNEDYRKVYGSLDDFTDLRQQYDNLLAEEYDFVNNVAYADVMSGNGSHRTYSIRSQQNRQDIDRICNDLNQCLTGIKMKDSTR